MSYFSTLLTSTTSRYASFRRTLLSSSSEDDSSIDDPENSHVSRVLRAYYTEKGRPFPAWLGPDPRAIATTQPPQRGFVGSASSSLRGQNSNITGTRNTGGGLGELWADKPAGEKPQDEQSGSLRRGLGQRPGMRGSGSGGQQHHNSHSGETTTVRQLPSQRAGSYQTTQNPYGQHEQSGQGSNTSLPSSQSSAVGGGSVQERLKARLGSRSAGTPSPPLSRDGAGVGGRPYVGAGSPWSNADDGYGGGGGDEHGPRYDGLYGRGSLGGQRQR